MFTKCVKCARNDCFEAQLRRNSMRNMRKKSRGSGIRKLRFVARHDRQRNCSLPTLLFICSLLVPIQIWNVTKKSFKLETFLFFLSFDIFYSLTTYSQLMPKTVLCRDSFSLQTIQLQGCSNDKQHWKVIWFQQHRKYSLIQ